MLRRSSSPAASTAEAKSSAACQHRQPAVCHNGRPPAGGAEHRADPRRLPAQPQTAAWSSVRTWEASATSFTAAAVRLLLQRSAVQGLLYGCWLKLCCALPCWWTWFLLTSHLLQPGQQSHRAVLQMCCQVPPDYVIIIQLDLPCAVGGVGPSSAWTTCITCNHCCWRMCHRLCHHRNKHFMRHSAQQTVLQHSLVQWLPGTEAQQ